MKIRCIFFDFDGVIIENSPFLVFEALREELVKYDLNLSLDYLIDNFQRMKGEVIISTLKSTFSKKIPFTIIDTIRNQYKNVLFEKAKLSNNLLKLLSNLDEQFICSSNYLVIINQLLLNNQIKNYFPDEVIFSIEKVISAKPAPEVYFKAMEKASTPLEKCCAIEDSITGVKAAKLSGLYTIGYVANISPNYREKQSETLIQAGADKVIYDLIDLGI